MSLRSFFKGNSTNANGTHADFDVGADGVATPTSDGALSTLGGWIKAHPWQTAGYGLTGAMNLGGLFDNDKLLGQLGGAAAGFGISKIPAVSGLLAAHGINPALVAMGGGALGSLFDKLRANKDAQYTE
jgi:hypothetical protein